MNSLGYAKESLHDFAATVERVRAAVAANGLGIVNEMDVTDVFRAKLNVAFSGYRIFGVCHPSSAYQVLSADKEMGLLLPCNIIVYEDAAAVRASAARPTRLLPADAPPALKNVANDVENKLIAIINAATI